MQSGTFDSEKSFGIVVGLGLNKSIQLLSFKSQANEQHSTQKGETMEKATCSRCDGKGVINWSRVANGVCFLCSGTGKVTGLAKIDKSKVDPEVRKKCEWILDAQRDKYENLDYAMLEKIRNFAHHYTMSAGAYDAYGDTVLDAWRDFGEAFFQKAMRAKLDAHYAK